MESGKNGWIKLYRKSIDSQVFQNEGLWKVWTWCLMKANHKDRWVPIRTGTGTSEISVKRGQFVFGRNSAAKELKTKATTVRGRMQKLANMQNLVISPVTHYSIITICNYDLYQGTNCEVVSLSPSSNRHPAVTNKNVEDERRKRNYVKDSIEFQLASLLLEEIRKNHSNLKQPDLQTWAKQIDLMIRGDKRAPETIRQVIEWCQKDSFWWKNILSASALRDKFDRLEAEIISKKKGKDEYENVTGYGRKHKS